MDYQNIPDPYDIKPQEEKRRAGFGAGMAAGFFAGVIVIALVFVAGIKIYVSTTGQYVVFGRQRIGFSTLGNVFDQAAEDKIAELLAYMDLYYYDSYESKDIQNAIYKGTVSGLGDPYSAYYTAEDFTDVRIGTTGNYCGIGAALLQDAKTKEVTITKVYEGTPAEEAGLLKEDKIVMVDEIESTSMELTLLVQRIRGEEGKTVHLVIYRESVDETFELDVVRRSVDLPSVEAEMLDGNIGYIQISEFMGNTPPQFEKKLKELKEAGMQGLIVDLRGNPGGMINAVVEVADSILPRGTVVYTEDKYGNRETYSSDARCLDCPLVVLVDKNSASASEIFAGAIRDYNYGTLVGTTTFGKGIVQTIFPLKNGDAIRITTANYFTPNGQNIHGEGIEPDYTVEYEYTGPDEKVYDMQYDSQIQFALDKMQELLDGNK